MTGVRAESRLPPRLRPTHPVVLAATWFGSGLLPGAPGTWGSLAALPFAALIHVFCGGVGLAVAAVLAFLVGWMASNAFLAAGRSGDGTKNDPREIVIDEVAGQWLVLAVVPPDVLLYTLGFLLFRVFDVMKPWPAGWIDRRLKSGLGVMLDDVAAAVYAAACLLLYRHFVGGG